MPLRRRALLELGKGQPEWREWLYLSSLTSRYSPIVFGGVEEMKMSVRVGKEAPDFEAGAFVDGGFQNIKLSDYRGKWVVLCFYPGDFTFV